MDGNLVVVEYNADRVQILDLQGNYIRKFGEEGHEPGKLQGPYGIAINQKGNFIISEWKNGRVSIFDPTGSFLRFLSKHPSLEYSSPFGLAVDLDDSIFCTDCGNNRYGLPSVLPTYSHLSRIQKFSSDGEFLLVFGDSVELPSGITIDSKSRLVVCSLKECVHIFSKEGDLLTTIGEPGSEDGQFSQPVGVVVTADGAIVATELTGHRVQVFRSLEEV